MFAFLDQDPDLDSQHNRVAPSLMWACDVEVATSLIIAIIRTPFTTLFITVPLIARPSLCYSILYRSLDNIKGQPEKSPTHSRKPQKQEIFLNSEQWSIKYWR